MTNNNLTNCRDCGKEVSKNADSCPHCGTQRFAENKMKASFVMGVALLPIAMGLFFLFATMMISAEKGGLNLIFWTTFIVLTVFFYIIKKGPVRNTINANWKYKDNSTTLGTILLYFPTWTIYVWSFVAAINVHRKHNNLLEDLSGGQMISIYIVLWLVGYRFFLKYFRLI